MRKLIFTIVFVISMAAGVFAQSDETTEIRLGGQKLIDRGRLKVRFVSVVEDSRCPMNARCVWAGNAKVQLTVQRGRSVKTIYLNSGKGERTATAFGYKFEYGDLTPQKGAPRPMANRPKTVTLNIDRI